MEKWLNVYRKNVGHVLKMIMFGNVKCVKKTM